MSQTCSACDKPVYCVRLLQETGKWLGLECGCFHESIVREMDNPFRSDGELTIEHIHDDSGKPLRVTSRRQLEEAEQRFNFNHIPTNMDRANWDSPKQQRVYTVGDHYQRKFARE